ncbi:MAG: mobile mystery protein B [Ignavibacteriae bacterium]|nr:MAG: mobile mystery protein B [Ignavibacteriota bacterium]
MKFEYPKGATPIDADEAEGLIPSHITLQKELNEWEEHNIADAALKYYSKEYKADKILDIYFLQDIHKDMFDETWKWAGQLRKTEKNIGVAPEKIREETRNLLDDIKYWIEHNTYGKDEICARFHHRLVWIHLFPNGNGRHARFAADLLAISLGIQLFTWGAKELYNDGEERTKYLEALQEADKFNYIPLLKFVKS